MDRIHKTQHDPLKAINNLMKGIYPFGASLVVTFTLLTIGFFAKSGIESWILGLGMILCAPMIGLLGMHLKMVNILRDIVENNTGKDSLDGEGRSPETLTDLREPEH